MAYYFDILEPTENFDESLDALTKNLGTLYMESWENDKRNIYNRPFNLNIATFAHLWFSKSLKLFIAYEEGTDKAVGFIIGMVFRPLPYEASVFQFEDWYMGGDKQMEKDMFKYATDAIRFIGCDELWVADRADRMPPIAGGWKEENNFQFRRYTKR